MTVQAVAYVRCSSDRQARQESSLPAQKAEIERRAKSDGATVVRWFEDDGISGKNVEDRPGLNACLDYIASPAGKGVVSRMYVYDSKRMARNRADAYAIRKELHRANVQLIALAQPSVDDEAANAILESVWDGIAEAERINLAKVVRRGQKQSLVDGWWPYPRPPYGFRSVGLDNARGARRFKLLPDPDTSAVVKRVFDLYLAGSGCKVIASTLDREGIRPPSRDDSPKQIVMGWRPKHVKNIIENVACWGATTWEDVVVNENHHPAIVDRATWETAQGLAKARARTPAGEALSSLNSGEVGLFRPWLRCGCCGGHMALNRGGQAGKRIAYYACSSRLMNNASCKGLTVKADDLDEAILATIENEILTPDAIRRMVEETWATLEKNAGGELREKRAALEARVEHLSGRLARLAACIAEGSMDLADVGPLSKPLRAEREAVRAELERLPEPQPMPAAMHPDDFRATITDTWRHPTMSVRRKAMDRILTEIVLEPGKAMISYSWKVEPSGSCMITLARPEPIPEVGRLTTPDLRRYVPSPGPWRSGFASSFCRPRPQ